MTPSEFVDSILADEDPQRQRRRIRAFLGFPMAVRQKVVRVYPPDEFYDLVFSVAFPDLSGTDAPFFRALMGSMALDLPSPDEETDADREAAENSRRKCEALVAEYTAAPAEAALGPDVTC